MLFHWPNGLGWWIKIRNEAVSQVRFSRSAAVGHGVFCFVFKSAQANSHGLFLFEHVYFLHDPTSYSEITYCVLQLSRFDDQSHHDKTDLSEPRPET